MKGLMTAATAADCSTPSACDGLVGGVVVPNDLGADPPALSDRAVARQRPKMSRFSRPRISRCLAGQGRSFSGLTALREAPPEPGLRSASYMAANRSGTKQDQFKTKMSTLSGEPLSERSAAVISSPSWTVFDVAEEGFLASSWTRYL